MNIKQILIATLVVSCSTAVVAKEPLTYPLVSTGQVLCYDVNGEPIATPKKKSELYGQDGTYQAGLPMAFQDNGDGTVSDLNTGLMWEQIPTKNGVTWAQAAEYCANLRLGGYDDWRLPTLKELFSISNFSQGWPYIDLLYFRLSAEGNVSKDEQYWASEKYVGETVEGRNNAAFGVNHGTGHIKAYPAGGDSGSRGGERGERGENTDRMAMSGDRSQGMGMGMQQQRGGGGMQRGGGMSTSVVEGEALPMTGEGLSDQMMMGGGGHQMMGGAPQMMGGGQMMPDSMVMQGRPQMMGMGGGPQMMGGGQMMPDSMMMQGRPQMMGMGGGPQMMGGPQQQQQGQQQGGRSQMARGQQQQTQQGGGGQAQRGGGGGNSSMAMSNPMQKQVRAVRGATYGVNNFVDNNDGTISDKATGLMWAKSDNGKGVEWVEALVYAESSKLAGYKNWRLPNIKELQSIVDYNYSPSSKDVKPAINPIFNCTPFVNEAGDDDFGYYWSGTSALFRKNTPFYFAWYVAFGRAVNSKGADMHGAGAVRFDSKSNNGLEVEGGEERYYNFVRLVREE